jgi:ubiquitin C-terminal hydrolase
MDFYRLPKILILQIKRFGYGKRGKVKLQNNVRIDKTINLNELRYESPNPQP